jgi:hypothetical protein
LKMLLIAFHQSIVEHSHALMKEYEVSAFTELHNVAGRGETGPTVQFFLSPGSNSMFLTAVSEQLAYRLIDGFTRFNAAQEIGRHDNVYQFVLPSEQAV